MNQKLIKTLLLSVLFIQLCYSDDKTYTPKDFEGGFFQFSDIQSGLYKVDIWSQNNYDSFENILLGFGDYDSNTYTDFLTLDLSNQSSQIYLYTWQDKEHNFQQKLVCNLTDGCGKNLVTAYPVDINYDGLLDVLILFNGEDDSSEVQSRQLIALIQEKQGNFQGDPNQGLSQIQLSPNSQPFLANLENFTNSGSLQRKSQIVYEDVNGERKVITVRDNLNIQKDTAFTNYVQNSAECKPDTYFPFSVPHYNAVVDINGDCMSDLVLTTYDETNDQIYIEFWIYQDNGKYCLEQTYPIDKDMGDFKGVQFADFGFDGGIDLAILYQKDEDTIIQIVSNSIEMDFGNLCTSNGKWGFNKANAGNTVLSGYSLDVVPDLDQPQITSQLRFGDVNLDGFNDIILTLKKGEFNLPYILLNDSSIKDKDANKKIQFKLQNEDNQDYNIGKLYKDEPYEFRQATFFDLNENGILDVYMNYYDPEHKEMKMLSVYNYVKNENYFLKTLGLNGQCHKSSDCQSALYYGASYECKVTVSDNSSRVGKAAQLSQSAYTPLQLPFSIIGLGRTNNYIENLKVGYPQSTDIDKNHLQTWQTIIPNSQLIIFPYGANPEKWGISIFIQPTKAVIVVIIVTASILFILGVVIFYCHLKEKEEDKKNSESLYSIFR